MIPEAQLIPREVAQRYRQALERLVEEFRWRVHSGGFRDRERQIFEEADKLLKEGVVE